MGLLALCVEFYRVTPTECSINVDNKAHPGSADFLKEHPNCNITCSETEGPKSALRGGSASDVYVIPVPRILTFNAGMLLAAGFCIPAILSLVFTWDKVLEANWERRRKRPWHVEKLDDPIEGANMTVGELRNVNELVRRFLAVIEIPLFGGVILTIIGVGEANFFSPQMLHMTEPMASLGQWSPIAGTIMAALGSLYILWSSSDEDDPPEKRPVQRGHTNSSVHSQSSNQWPSQRSAHSPDRWPRNYNMEGASQSNALGIRSESPNDIALIPTITHTRSDINHFEDISQGTRQDDHQDDQPTAGRHKVRRWLTAAGDYLGDAAHEKLDLEHKHNENEVRAFPEVPGEGLRNPALESTSKTYERMREARASSTYSPSIRSTSDIGGKSSPPPVNESPRPETSPIRPPKRRATLEVPKEVHRRSESHGSVK
ncbi:hypothetical protein DDE83_004169 [Stemphylium lycopersici]|uniref:Uncharacterized protein n=1 Tax=Stemphylium lycopersici TaxID=183478 RepID=A0A364N5B8_STELY|nr:hypothetical protein DDE83_004169 [Stemphylium lycopersici]